jgi:sulfatase modifying factor 1
LIRRFLSKTAHFGIVALAAALVILVSDSAATTVVTLRTPGPARILIRASHFRMGSTIPEIAAAQSMCRLEPLRRICATTFFADEMVAHEVMLSDYWIDRTEVTARAYLRCVDAGVCTSPGYAAAQSWHKQPNVPVTLVSWYDASAYCSWVGARLPTEAEFERAAKGWARRLYPWGNVFNPKLTNHGRFAPDQLNDVDGYAELAPVGSFTQGKTREGVLDLAGNVEEWVSDWYAPGYPEADVVDPRGPGTGDERVIRGGSYMSGRAWLRTTARWKDLPSRRRPDRGFRCAKTHHPLK